jgi:hypothetical protein
MSRISRRGMLGAGLAGLPTVAPRVAISQAYYSVGDAAYVTALAGSSLAKTLPFPSVPIPASGVGHVAIKHAAIGGNSPPLLIEALSGTPSSVKVYVSYDSVDGSAGSGTWTDESAYFPIFSSSSNTWTRGQRYFWRTNAEHVTAGITGATLEGERWERVEYTNGSAVSTLNPCVAASSGEWYWFVGMSIVRNMLSGTAYLTTRNSFIAAVPGSDPFLFVTALTGANAATIKTAQVDVVAASAPYKRFLRGVYIDPWINELANSGNRPFSGLSAPDLASMLTRLTACYTGIAATVPSAPLLTSMVGYGNYANVQYSPALVVPTAVEDPNGNDKFIASFMSVLRAQSPLSVDPAYDWPWNDNFSWMALYYATDLSDDIHPNSTGLIKQRGSNGGVAGYIWPLMQLMTGLAAPTAVNWVDKFIAGLGATPTVAVKARALEIFDALDQRGYPTANGTAITNRAARRAFIAALPTS